MPRIVYESLHDAFWSNVEAGDKEECWPWRPLMEKGHIRHATVQFQKKSYGAHRLSYMLHHGLEKISDNMVVMHTCDNPPCVNPNHLSLGTQQDNIKDAGRKGRTHKRGAAILTPAEVQHIRNLRGVMTYEDIAGAYNVSYWAVQAVMNGKRWSAFADTGAPDQRRYHAERGKLTPALVKDMRALAASGTWTWKALGERFVLDASTVRKVCLGQRWKDIEGPQPMKRGQKLTEQQAACVCHMYGCKSAKETAKQFGLSEVSVHDMWNGKVKKWAHLVAA